MASAAASQDDGSPEKTRPLGMKGWECPVCYSLYDREDHLAKSLRCGHTACMDCLKQLHSTDNRVRCPNCRKEHAVEGSVEDFPTNYSLLDALDAVCVTCQQQLAVETITNLCRECFQVHSSAMKMEFQETLETTQAKIAEFRELAKNGEKIKRISAMEIKLIAEIKVVFSLYRNILNAKEKKMIEDVRKDAKSDVESVRTKQEELEKTAEVLQCKLDDFACSSAKLMPTDITEAARHLGQLKKSSKEIKVLAGKAQAEQWTYISIFRCQIHECTRFLKYLSLHHCKLCADRNLYNEVHSVSDDSMWYGETCVKQCFDNKSLEKEVFNKPHDLAISPVDGKVVVANEGNRSLAVFERIDDIGVRRRTKYEFQKLLDNLGDKTSKFFGVAIDKNDQIYASDWNGNCVWVFSGDGELVRKICIAGNGALHYPTGIAIDQEAGHLYICDNGNSRVQVVTLEGGYVRSFGRRRRLSDSEDNGPWYIVVEEGITGKIYVEDCENKIYVYKKNGTFLQTIDTDKQSEYGLAMDNYGNLLTANKHPNVFLKSTQYDVYVQLGKRESDQKYSFGAVRGIAVDSSDKVLVCDYKRNNLKVLATWFS